MIKKRIPEKYDYDVYEIEQAVREIFGNDFVMEFKGRFITIDKTLTTAEKQALKDAIMPLLTEIQDITV